MPINVISVNRAWSLATAKNNDYVPDTKAVKEMYDAKAKMMLYYKHVRNEDGGWDRVIVDVKKKEQIKRNANKKVYTDDQRLEIAMKNARNLGLKFDANTFAGSELDKNTPTEGHECQCGFVAVSDTEYAKHKRTCTFAIDQVTNKVEVQ